MSLLDRKLLRDIKAMRGQVLTIALLVAAGVAVFVGSVSTYDSLNTAVERFYSTARFPQVFVTLKRAPLSIVPQLNAVPGVAAIEPRIVREVIVDWPAAAQPVSARMVSLNQAGDETLARLHMRRGGAPEPGSPRSAAINEAFAEANCVSPGDDIRVLLNGKVQAFHVSGVALSPEYVYAVKPGLPIPDDRLYAILWVDRSAAEAAFDMKAAFNDAVISLTPGTDPKPVIDELDRLLEPYGSVGAVERRDQPSNRFLEDELNQQKVMSTTIPFIFFGVAAFLLNGALARLVAAQREQIAALKALGFPTAALILHYLKLILVIVLIGSALGIAAGWGFGVAMIASYKAFFRLPDLPFQLTPWSAALGLAISLVAGSLGVLTALRQVVRLAPAVAMRPAAPLGFRRSWIEALLPRNAARSRRMMILRNTAGRPFRSLLTVAGVAFAVPMMVLGIFWRDAINEMIDLQFNLVERGNTTVTFPHPMDRSIMRDLAREPGVLVAEGQRIVPVRLRVEQRSYLTSVIGLSLGDVLRRPHDAMLRPIAAAPDGITLSRRLAERLKVEIGDLIVVEAMEGRRRKRGLPVSAVVDESIGMTSYMDIETLNGFTGEGAVISAASLYVEPTAMPALGRKFKNLPTIESVTMKAYTLSSFMEKIAALVAPAVEYIVDAGQRSVLFLDVMRQRGDQYREQTALSAPHVLQYAAELIMDGRKLEEPVNYVLVRIIPPQGLEIDSERRPFIVVDPRAGHGPGIGGFKADSEIGVAMKAGHTCYFVGFLPEPMPGQTIERIARAEALFIEKVISLHPDADGKPCVIGNCQAGWAMMILASLRPDLFGPLIIAGAPLAYWAGVHGKYPMRYSGGLLGGSWLTALTSDLGGGKFDGAWLVQNFENQNPSNTLWTKQYNVYSKIDTEADRYLDFERWWGGHVNLNAEEIQFIVDELFIGNNLAAGRIEMSDGQKVDLHNIRSPIVVFCSEGDNVTPPQQALDWILDCYADVDEIRAYGQTIVYTVHKSVGHLGIFVSGGVAKKEHAEFSSNIDLIDVLPPGLYEATFEAKDEETASSDLVVGQWVMRCEARTLDDIRAMGANSPEDERRFAAAKRISQLNLAAYQKFVQPWIKKAVTPQVAEMMRNLHPLRLQYEALSSQNPWMSAVKIVAEKIEENRKPASKDNPFLAFQEQMSKQIIGALDAWRDAQEALSEKIFLNVYGSRALQAALGIDREAEPPRRREMSAEHRAMLEKRTAELKSKIAEGGPREAVIRSLLYIGSARGMVDERSIEALRQVRRDYSGPRITLPDFKMLVREQFFTLLLDQERALAAISKLLPDDMDQRRAAFVAMRQVLSASAEITGERAHRLQRIAGLFGIDLTEAAEPSQNIASFDPRAKAS